MASRKAKLIGLLAVVVMVLGGLYWYFAPVDFDECVISEMKALPPSMYSNASEVCARRAGMEVSIPQEEIKWSAANAGLDTWIAAEDKTGRRRLTRAEVLFSNKACADKPDYTDWETLVAQNLNSSKLFRFQPKRPFPECVKPIRWSGIYIRRFFGFEF